MAERAASKPTLDRLNGELASLTRSPNSAIAIRQAQALFRRLGLEESHQETVPPYRTAYLTKYGQMVSFRLSDWAFTADLDWIDQ